jgi:hypothetical protein
LLGVRQFEQRGPQWECGPLSNPTTTCANLIAADPWENCSQTACDDGNYPLNGLACWWAFPNNLNLNTNQTATPSVSTRCDADPMHNRFARASTDNGICQGDWTCFADCAAGQEVYNLGKPPGDPQSREHCCTQGVPPACIGHAGQSMAVNDSCGWPGANCSTVMCNSTTCPGGCCAAGVCQAGTGKTACGTDGAACASCSGTNVCDATSRTCVAACNPSNCTGCCNGDTCVAGSATSACGNSGLDCEACGADTPHCRTGPPAGKFACRP